MPRIPSAYSIYTPLYNTKLKSLMRYAKRLEKQGFDIDYSTFPKALTKANRYNWERIESWTYEDVRLRATRQSNGKSVSYREYAHEKRSQASRKGWQTRSKNIQSFQDFFNTEEYIPEQSNIVMNNFLQGTAKQIMPTDFFDYLLDLLTGPIDDTLRWYKRKRKAMIKSTEVMEKVADMIRKIISNKKSNKIYYENIIKAGEKDTLMAAIDKVIYGYDEDAISLGYSTVVRILSNKDYILSAAEYNEADEEFE